MGKLWVFVGLLLTGMILPARSAASVVKLVSDCESTAGWSNGAQLQTDAHEGARSVVTDLASGNTTFFTLDYADTGIDLSQIHALALWWRVEGDGLTDLKIKLVNHPLVDGMQAVYDIWKPANAYPSVWRRSTIVLSEYDAVWGSEPNLTARRLTFRTVTASGANVRLFVDHI
ncbi:MAG: hypothetical protein QGG64_18115, partial [Candidatus Latescibacteria bacterium]|nr:hypothetical protein [Candidatus Latescibacterota bacterium]